MRKKNIRTKIGFIVKPVALCIGIIMYIVYSQGCANTSRGPSGGPKDTIAPVIVASIPAELSTNFPTLKGKVLLTFNEYVQLKNQMNEIIVSPPSKKKPQTRIKGKSIQLSFKDTLREDQTYTIYFGNSISDVNESNPFPNYSFTFSTGNIIDSLLISGTVLDYKTLFPIKGATVLLYRNPKDSSVLKELPVAVAKSDDWGYFCVRGLKGEPYTLYAIEDKNYNYLYNKGGEKGGFADKEITPTIVAKPGLPQIEQYDVKDTLSCLSRPSEVDIYLFQETSDVQYLKSYGRINERECYLTFNTNNIQIDTFQIKGIFNDRIIKQLNDAEDSLTFWINDQRKLADTLLLRVNYMRTDSTGTLVPKGETLKLAMPFDKSKIQNQSNTTNIKSYAESLGNTGIGKNQRENDLRNKEQEREDEKDNEKKKQENQREDLLKMQYTAKGESVENKGVELLFAAPLIKIVQDSIQFTQTNPRQIKSPMKFRLEKDPKNVLRYIICAEEEYKLGYDYRIYIPTATFTDINNFTNDSTDFTFKLPSNDKLSSITLEVSNVNGKRYIVDLVNEARENVFLTYQIENDTTLLFPYLSPNNYSFRITEDENKNGKIDVGNVLLRKQPEKVRLFKLPDGSAIITLKEQTDLTQSVDLEKLFSQ